MDTVIDRADLDKVVLNESDCLSQKVRKILKGHAPMPEGLLRRQKSLK